MTLRSICRFSSAFVYFSLVIGCVVVSSCSKSSSNTFPAIAPLVAKSLPQTLAPTSTTANIVIQKKQKPQSLHKSHTLSTVTPTNLPSAQMAHAASYIQSLFTNSYNNSNDGGADQGLVNMLVITIDGRMAGINKQTSTTSSGCLSATATPYTIDLTNIDATLKLDLAVQCSSTFSNNSGGSGVLFGQAAATTSGLTNYSLQMSLGPMGGGATASFYSLGGFFAAANVTNYNSTAGTSSTDTANPTIVDGMLIAYQTASAPSPQMWVARFKANTTTNNFELFLAANEPNIQGATSGTYNGVGDGFRMITGTGTASGKPLVYADGTLFDPAIASYGTYYNFNACIDASSTTMVAADLTNSSILSDCQTLANSFTLAQTPSLTFAEVMGYPNAAAPASGSSCAAVNQTSFDSSSNCPASYGPPSPSPQSSVFTNLNTYFPVSNANVTALGH
jgi:hypothetical protein